MSDQELLRQIEEVRKMDKRKETSKTNAQKAREAKLKKLNEQKLLREKYSEDINSSDEDSSSGDENDVFVYKPKGNQIIKPVPTPSMRYNKEIKAKPSGVDDEMKKKVDQLEYMIAMMSNKPKRKTKTKKIIIEKEIKPDFIPQPVAVNQPAVSNQPVVSNKQNDQLNDYMKRAIIKWDS